jgi:hypothetical protein
MFHSFFLSAIPLPKIQYQSFCKKQFYCLFFTNFETLFFVFIFSYSFSGTYSAPLDQVLLLQYWALNLWNPKQAAKNNGPPTVPM